MLTSQQAGGPRRFRSLLLSIVMLVVAGSAISSAYNLVHPKGIFRTPPAFVDSLRAPAAAGAKPPATPIAAAPAGTLPGAAGAGTAPDSPGPGPAAARAHAPVPGVAARHVTGGQATRPSPDAPHDTAGTHVQAAAPAQAPEAPPAYPPATSPASSLRGLVQIETEDAYASFRQRSAIFVDARDSEHFNLGHIPGAVDLPISDFSAAFPKVEGQLPRDARLIVYCEGVDCDEAQTLSWELVGRGYKGILYFKKGWEAWDKAGYPQEAGAPAAK